MKRPLLVAVMVLVSLVGIVGFSRAVESQNDTPTMSAISNVVSALQATANPTTGPVTELLATVNPVDEIGPYYDPDKGAVIEPTATVNPVDEIGPYCDPDKGAVTEPTATVSPVDEIGPYYDPDKGAVIEPATVNAGVLAKRRMYYLTQNSFTGSNTTTACDSGFHMASLSEIQDPSKVQYAPGRITVYDTGWVRTQADPVTGFGYNCDVWRSSSDQQSGTTMTRWSLWRENNGHSLYEESDPAAWWQSTRTVRCSEPEPVWCVEDDPA